MSETLLFAWGVLATIFAVGPLMLAAVLDWRAKRSGGRD